MARLTALFPLIPIRRWADIIALTIALICGGLIAFSHIFLFPSLLNSNVIALPYLLGEGLLPYTHIGDLKTPLLYYFVKWIIPIFSGDAVRAVRAASGLWIVAIVTAVLYYLFRNFGKWAMTAGGVFFLAWSMSYGYWALLYFDFFTSLLYLAVAFLLANEKGTPRPAIVAVLGLLVGLAGMVKQQGFLLGPLVFIWLIWKWRLGSQGNKLFAYNTLLLMAGGIPPALIYTVLFLAQGGNLTDMAFWLIQASLLGQYPSMARILPGKTAFLELFPSLLLVFPFLWSLMRPYPAMRPGWGERMWLFGLTTLAGLYVYPRWSGRHLATIFPFMALMTGIATYDLLRKPSRTIRYLASCLAVGGVLSWWLVAALGIYSFNLQHPSRDKIGEYTWLLEPAEKIRPYLSENNRVLLFPSDESNLNLYYILRLKPPHFIVHGYPWFIKEQKVQSRWFEMMENEQPEVVLYFPGRWEIENIVPEMVGYILAHYSAIEQVRWEEGQIWIMQRNATP